MSTTQQDVDKAFEMIKAEWGKKVLDSGKSEHMFIATDNTGFVANFLSNYNFVKGAAETEGFVMPELIIGLKVEVT